METREDLLPDRQPGRRDPVAAAARDKLAAESYYWPYWTAGVPCLVAFAAGVLILAWSLASQPTSGFELARSAVAWVLADRGFQKLDLPATSTEHRRVLAVLKYLGT